MFPFAAFTPQPWTWPATPTAPPATPPTPPRLDMFAQPALANPTFSTQDLNLAPKPVEQRGLTSFAGMGSQQPPQGGPEPMSLQKMFQKAPEQSQYDPATVRESLDRLRRGGPLGVSNLHVDERDEGVFRGGPMQPRGGTFHYTGGSTAQGAIDTLRKRGLSYNYLIDRDGSIIGLVPPDHRAAHMRPSNRGVEGLGNQNMIGYAFVGMGEKDMTPQQQQAAYELASRDARRFGLKPEQFYGHGELNSHKEAIEGTTLAKMMRERGLYEPTSARDISTADVLGKVRQSSPQLVEEPQLVAQTPSPGAPRQIAAQEASPTVSRQRRAASASSSGGLGGFVSDFFSNIFPQAAAQQPGASPDYMASIERLAGGDPVLKQQLTEYASLLNMGPKSQVWSPGQRFIGTTLDAIGADLRARGGSRNAQMLTPSIIANQERERQAREAREYAGNLKLGEIAITHRQKIAAEERRRAAIDSVLGKGSSAPPAAASAAQAQTAPLPQAPQMPQAPSGAPAAGPGPALPRSPLTAPVTPVERQELADPSGGAQNPPGLGPMAPYGPTASAPSPSMNDAPPQGVVPPAPAPEPPPFRMSMPGLAQASPQIAPQQETSPSGPAGPASKYRAGSYEDIEARFPFPYSQDQITRAMIADPSGALAKQLSAANEFTQKQRDAYLKAHEVNRTDNPELAGEKARASAIGKGAGDLEVQKKKAGIEIEGVVNTLRSVKDIVEADDWSDFAVGRFDTSDDGILPFGFGPSGKTFARIATSANKVGVDELRARVESRMGAVASKMKGMVRGAGEGAWSDRDQAALEKLVGDISQSQNADEVKRRVDQAWGMINDAFAKPLGVAMPELGPTKKQRDAAAKAAGTPKRLKFNPNTGELE